MWVGVMVLVRARVGQRDALNTVTRSEGYRQWVPRNACMFCVCVCVCVCIYFCFISVCRVSLVSSALYVFFLSLIEIKCFVWFICLICLNNCYTSIFSFLYDDFFFEVFVLNFTSFHQLISVIKLSYKCIFFSVVICFIMFFLFLSLICHLVAGDS